MNLTRYTVPSPLPEELRIILASDLHGRSFGDALERIRESKPHLILCPGDMMENAAVNPASSTSGFRFMKEAAAFAPVYYSLGNHERGMSDENRKLLRDAGIVLLDDDTVMACQNIRIGGLTSGFVNAVRRGDEYNGLEPPDSGYIERFSALPGFKILLCHHPEYYPRYLRDRDIDIIVSGHAHGGQWKLFGKSIYAPGQGLFPRYVSGVYDNRLCVGCGMANTVVFPRFFNPVELVLLTLKPAERTAS